MAELGIKVFGNEISYWNAEGDEEIMKSLARLNPQLRVLEILSGKVRVSLHNYLKFNLPTNRISFNSQLIHVFFPVTIHLIEITKLQAYSLVQKAVSVPFVTHKDWNKFKLHVEKCNRI